MTAQASGLPSETQCAFFESFGPTSLKVGNLACPTPSDLGTGEVILRVHVVALNPADYKMRKGEVNPIQGKPSRKKPIIMGYDCSGTVVAVGPGVNTTWRVGDEVCGVALGGALSQYATAYQDNLARKPPGVSYADAACLVTACLTALQQLKLAGAG